MSVLLHSGRLSSAGIGSNGSTCMSNNSSVPPARHPSKTLHLASVTSFHVSTLMSNYRKVSGVGEKIPVRFVSHPDTPVLRSAAHRCCSRTGVGGGNVG